MQIFAIHVAIFAHQLQIYSSPCHDPDTACFLEKVTVSPARQQKEQVAWVKKPIYKRNPYL